MIGLGLPLLVKPGAVFVPPTGITNWYKADSLIFQDVGGTTPVTANGQNVRYWGDYSGNGHGMPRSGADPTWTAATSANGKPAVTLTTGCFNAMPNTPAATAFTAFVVWSTTLTGGAAFGRALDGRDAAWLMGPRSNAGAVMVAAYAGAFAGYASMSTGEVIKHSATQNASLLSHYKSGTLIGTLATPSNFPGGFFLGGSGEPLHGDLYEILIWSRVLTAPELATVNAYLTAAYP